MVSELVTVSAQELTVANPEESVRQGQNAARTLMTVMNRKPKKVFIQGKRFLEFEDWQLIGEFYGYSVQTKVESIEVEGVKGAKATSVLYDRHGTPRGGAEAFCMRDEEGRKNQEWFKLASMAQTRSGSKALSNRFKWVAVLAGTSGKTAEENMVEGNTREPQTGSESTSPEASDTAVLEIKSMMFSMHKGDDEKINEAFKQITKWKDKTTKEEKWLKLDDLDRIAKSKPDWFERIHGKVTEIYNAYAGTAQE